MSRFFIVSAIFLIFFCNPTPTESAMTGGEFEIYADSVGFIDSQGSTGGDFTLYGSGEAYQGASSTDGTFVVRGGFQSQEKGILSFSVSSSSINLGTLSTGSVSSATVTTTISTDSETGYTLAITEDGNLRKGSGGDSDDIDDTAGSVDAGSEEYGIATSGTDGLLGSDAPISGSVAVASASGTVTARQTGVIFKASIAPATANGSYTHTVTFTATVNP